MHFNHGNPIFKSYFTIISITPSPKRIGNGDSTWHGFSLINIMWLRVPKYGIELMEIGRR